MAKRRSEQEWLFLANEFNKSNLTLTSWCKNKEVSKSSIYPYINKIKNKVDITEPHWGQISFPKSVESPSISLKIGTVSLEIKNGFDKELLLNVLKVVSNLC